LSLCSRNLVLATRARMHGSSSGTGTQDGSEQAMKREKRKSSSSKMQKMMGDESSEAAEVVASFMHHDGSSRPVGSTIEALEQLGIAKADVHEATLLSARHAETYEVSAAKMWATLSDWSAPFMAADDASPFAIREIAGAGVGATRVVVMLGSTATWSEQVTAFDEHGMAWSYGITSPLPSPFDVFENGDFLCTVSVEADGPDRCRASIASVYRVVEGTDPAAVPPLELIYMRWLEAAVGCARALP